MSVYADLLPRQSFNFYRRTRELTMFKKRVKRQLTYIGCIGFTVWLSYATSSLLSTCVFWLILCIFGASIMCGLLYFMRGIAMLSRSNNYDIYEVGLRVLLISQILLSASGILLLCLFLYGLKNPSSDTIQVRTGTSSLIYPYKSDTTYKIELDNGKAVFVSNGADESQ